MHVRILPHLLPHQNVFLHNPNCLLLCQEKSKALEYELEFPKQAWSHGFVSAECAVQRTQLSGGKPPSEGLQGSSDTTLPFCRRGRADSRGTARVLTSYSTASPVRKAAM